MGAEKLPISYLDVLATAVASHHDASHTCTAVVHRSKLETKKLGALKVQGPSFVTTLRTEALLCRQPASCYSCRAQDSDKKKTCSRSSGLLIVILIAGLIKSADLFRQYRS